MLGEVGGARGPLPFPLGPLTASLAPASGGVGAAWSQPCALFK